jgi:hypothetical protein
MLARMRPRDIAGKTRRRIAAEEPAELVGVEAKIRPAAGLRPSSAGRPSSTSSAAGRVSAGVRASVRSSATEQQGHPGPRATAGSLSSIKGDDKAAPHQCLPCACLVPACIALHYGNAESLTSSAHRHGPRGSGSGCASCGASVGQATDCAPTAGHRACSQHSQPSSRRRTSSAIRSGRKIRALMDKDVGHGPGRKAQSMWRRRLSTPLWPAAGRRTRGPAAGSISRS